MTQRQPTTYIIAGTPRAGKSLVMAYLLKRYKIPGISTDLLREGFGEGYLDLGIRTDSMEQSDEERSQILWPFFKGILETRRYYTDKLTIEGTNFLPKLLSEIKDRSHLRVCFLGFSTVNSEDKFRDIRLHKEIDDWTNQLSDDELRQLVRGLIKISQDFEQGCRQYGFRFFDTSKDFDKVVKEAAEYLVEAI